MRFFVIQLMSKLVIRSLNHKVVPIADPNRSLLAHLHTQALDWMYACGGRGRCTTCRIRILDGAEHLSEPSAAEVRFRTQQRLRDDERLACQAYLADGQVLVSVPTACRLPHLTYTD